MKRQAKKVPFYTLHKGDKFWDYVWGGQYHQLIRCDDIEEKDVYVWNAVDIETGDLFHYDFDNVVEILSPFIVIYNKIKIPKKGEKNERKFRKFE